MSNVIPFPGRAKEKPAGQCYNDDLDDPCFTEQKRLEKNRKFGEVILSSSGGGGMAVNQYNTFARSFNQQVRIHNQACPRNTVAELPEISGPTGTVK